MNNNDDNNNNSNNDSYNNSNNNKVILNNDSIDEHKFIRLWRVYGSTSWVGHFGSIQDPWGHPHAASQNSIPKKRIGWTAGNLHRLQIYNCKSENPFDDFAGASQTWGAIRLVTPISALLTPAILALFEERPAGHIWTWHWITSFREVEHWHACLTSAKIIQPLLN